MVQDRDQGLLQPIKYKRGELFQVLDQLKVPHELVFRDVKNVADGVDSIKTMQVRGAPLIAMVGCLSIAIELPGKEFKTGAEFLKYIEVQVQALVDARPTAVNMKREGESLKKFVGELIAKSSDMGEIKTKKSGQPAEFNFGLAWLIPEFLDYIEELLTIDLAANKAIGDYGAEDILKRSKTDKVNVLTHCNTGSLATSGYGTALGVVRSLFQKGKLERAFFTETRPYNQGSRLTAFELLHDKIPSTLICDSAVSWLMKNKQIAAVIVGADRVAKNGDTANKVGTYQLALAAKAHGVKFYIAAPFSTYDVEIKSGDEIVIEERSPTEVTHIAGKAISPESVHVWNPAFDVTPANLITGIITEKGVFAPEELASKI